MAANRTKVIPRHKLRKEQRAAITMLTDKWNVVGPTSDHTVPTLPVTGHQLFTKQRISPRQAYISDSHWCWNQSHRKVFTELNGQVTVIQKFSPKRVLSLAKANCSLPVPKYKVWVMSIGSGVDSAFFSWVEKGIDSKHTSWSSEASELEDAVEEDHATPSSPITPPHSPDIDVVMVDGDDSPIPVVDPFADPFLPTCMQVPDVDTPMATIAGLDLGGNLAAFLATPGFTWPKKADLPTRRSKSSPLTVHKSIDAWDCFPGVHQSL